MRGFPHGPTADQNDPAETQSPLQRLLVLNQHRSENARLQRVETGRIWKWVKPNSSIAAVHLRGIIGDGETERRGSQCGQESGVAAGRAVHQEGDTIALVVVLRVFQISGPRSGRRLEQDAIRAHHRAAFTQAKNVNGRTRFSR